MVFIDKQKVSAFGDIFDLDFDTMLWLFQNDLIDDKQLKRFLADNSIDLEQYINENYRG